MTHGRVETPFLVFKLNYHPKESCLEDKNSILRLSLLDSALFSTLNLNGIYLLLEK
jgi:hypothetical protein